MQPENLALGRGSWAASFGAASPDSDRLPLTPRRPFGLIPPLAPGGSPPGTKSRLNGQVAQSVEQGTENPRVGSSILSLATIFPSEHWQSLDYPAGLIPESN